MSLFAKDNQSRVWHRIELYELTDAQLYQRYSIFGCYSKRVLKSNKLCYVAKT